MPKHLVNAAARLFFVLSLCFGLAVAPTVAMAGSMTLLGVGGPTGGGAFTPGCTASSNWLTRLGSAPLYGLSSTTLRNAYDTMICGMVSDGDFAQLDALYIFATDTTTIAKMNVVSTSFTATFNGASEASHFTAGQGYTGGSGVFLSTGVDPSAGGLNYTATSSSMGVYIPIGGTRTTGQAWADVGDCDNATTCETIFHDVFPKFTDNNAYAQFGGNASVAMTNADGFSVGVRTSASAMALWKNGSSAASSSSAAGSVPNSIGGFYILARNAHGTADSASADQISAVFIGGGGVSPANLSNRVNTFMSSLPSPINAY